MPNARLDPGIPIQILAARDGNSFGRIFPEFPFDKRHVQPVGLFVPGEEKNYIGLRTNVSGQFPYEDIYKEYARMVLRLSYHSLPPWLQEGYTNVFGSLTFTEKGPKLGKPDPEDLSVLWESPLLPLDLLLHVDRNSAYYQSGSKTTVYFAESRALVHYLLSDPQVSETKSLEKYVALVEGGADSLQAARQVFGNLDQLQRKLEAYVKQTSTAPADIQGAGGSESYSSARTLSTAETEMRMGEFTYARGQLDNARTKLENAIMLDPMLASAEETLGYLSLRQSLLEEAEKHFNRASELDPKSALAVYGQSKVAMVRGGLVGVSVGAIVALEKTVALNPEFAPAWYDLASIYSARAETLQKALTAAQRSVSLAPGEAGYQYQLAVILQTLGRTDEARKVAEQLASSSDDIRTSDKATTLLAQISQPKTAVPPPSVGNPSPTSSTPSTPDRSVRIVTKTEPDDKPAESLSNQPRDEAGLASTTAVAPPITIEERVYSMVGSISGVSCAEAPQIQMTLKAQTIVMHLHADDVSKMSVKSSGASSVAKNTACTGLNGRSARISYQLAHDKKWDGEIQSIELR